LTLLEQGGSNSAAILIIGSMVRRLRKMMPFV
jgi:hypothetical protein